MIAIAAERDDVLTACNVGNCLNLNHRATIDVINALDSSVFGTGGIVIVTQGVNALGQTALMQIGALVMENENVSEENDPYGEHDFGSIDFTTDTVAGNTIKV